MCEISVIKDRFIRNPEVGTLIRINFSAIQIDNELLESLSSQSDDVEISFEEDEELPEEAEEPADDEAEAEEPAEEITPAE